MNEKELKQYLKDHLDIHVKESSYEHEYCLKCGNENPQDRAICECGGRNFIFGDNFTFENGKAICKCGNDQFKMIAHINMSPIYNKTYKCINCGKTFGMQTYYKSEYEGDED